LRERDDKLLKVLKSLEFLIN